jgi:cobalt-zinc-cadmium efflux system outer membrane protein
MMSILMGHMQVLLRNAFITLMVTSWATSCTKVHQADDCQVVHAVQERIAKRVHWYQNSQEDKQVSCLIEQLLQQDFQVDAAIQIALLNNLHIQASFEDLGIAQADLVQAGLFQNPILQAFVRFPNKNSASTNTEFSVTQSFMEIFLIPLRKKVAENEVERVHFQIGGVVLELAFAVREAYYNLQAAQSKLGLLELLVEVTDAKSELAKQQIEAGNINELTFQAHKAEYIQAKLALSSTQNEIAKLRQEMNVLLGLRPSLCNWRIPNDLLDLPPEETSMEELEKIALAKRLDLAAAHMEIKRLELMGATKEWWAYTEPGVGVSREKDADGITVLGPSMATSLPFFNHGQADRARLFAMYKQSKHRLQALEIDILAQVRMHKEQLAINRNRVLIYIQEYLPLQKDIVATSQNFYNVMGLSLYTFLQNKEQEIQSKISYIDALQDYWLTRVNLERATGGSL